MWSRTAFALGCLAFLASPFAGASETDPLARENAKVRIMGNLGIGSAVGELGGTVTVAPIPEVQLELGAGLGLAGVQFSLMPKLALGNRHDRLILGAGPTLAVGENPNPSRTCASLWLNLEVGYEYRSTRGFSFLIAVGLTKGVAGEMPGLPAPGVYEPGDTTTPEAVSGLPVFPQGRIALGHWF
jgi:hypothetical protein